jgi:hypothetical protein
VCYTHYLVWFLSLFRIYLTIEIYKFLISFKILINHENWHSKLYAITICAVNELRGEDDWIQTYTQCTRPRTGSLEPQLQHLVLNTICTNIHPVLLKMGIYSRCPKHVEIIFDNESQLLHQVGTSCQFIHDARSHIHQKMIHTYHSRCGLLSTFTE